MLNNIQTAIRAFHTANNAIPITASDDDMDAAVDRASKALQAVIDTPATTREAVIAKYELATSLVEWDSLRSRLVERANAELLAALFAEQKAV